MKNHLAFRLIRTTKTTLKMIMQPHWLICLGAAHDTGHPEMSDKPTRWKFKDEVFRPTTH
jgi:hypothetical protein